jgi:hypothetical protein
MAISFPTSNREQRAVICCARSMGVRVKFFAGQTERGINGSREGREYVRVRGKGVRLAPPSEVLNFVGRVRWGIGESG